MSAVRMCDGCGVIFAEGAEGSTILSGSKVIRDQFTGAKRTEQTTQDRCPKCSGHHEPTPRISIAGAAGKSDPVEVASDSPGQSTRVTTEPGW